MVEQEDLDRLSSVALQTLYKMKFYTLDQVTSDNLSDVDCQTRHELLTWAQKIREHETNAT